MRYALCPGFRDCEAGAVFALRGYREYWIHHYGLISTGIFYAKRPTEREHAAVINNVNEIWQTQVMNDNVA
jgi:hypothetical protein